MQVVGFPTPRSTFLPNKNFRYIYKHYRCRFVAWHNLHQPGNVFYSWHQVHTLEETLWINKSLDCYKYFVSGWVREVLVKIFSGMRAGIGFVRDSPVISLSVLSPPPKCNYQQFFLEMPQAMHKFTILPTNSALLLLYNSFASWAWFLLYNSLDSKSFTALHALPWFVA